MPLNWILLYYITDGVHQIYIRFVCNYRVQDIKYTSGIRYKGIYKGSCLIICRGRWKFDKNLALIHTLSLDYVLT